MTHSLRIAADGSTALQPSALNAQTHERFIRNAPGYDEARPVWDGTIHHADRRDLNDLLEKGEAT